MMNNIPNDTYKPEMQATSDVSVLILTADRTEDLELFYPYYRLVEAGCKVDIATPDGGEFKGKMGIGLKDSLKLASINPASYRMLYIPGGKAPEALMKDDKAVEIVKSFVAAGKPVAAICHGPQLLAKAGVITGKRISAWPEVQPEVEKAGASYVSEAALVDGQFITGRWPADLPAFTSALMARLQKNMDDTSRLRSAA